MSAMRGFVAGVLAAGLLASCSYVGLESGSDRPCPSMGGLQNATRQVKFAPTGGRDLTDVIFEAEILEVTGSCAYDDDKLDLDLMVTFAVRRGPADRQREGLLRYFAALVGPDERVLHRSPKSLVFKFPANQERIVVRQRASLTDVPFPADPAYDPTAFWAVAGIVLSHRELEYNRGR